MKNLILRSISGIVYVGLFVAALIFESYLYFLLALLFNVLAFNEASAILQIQNKKNRFIYIAVSAVVFCSLFLLNRQMQLKEYLVVPSVIVIVVLSIRSVLPRTIKINKRYSFTFLLFYITIILFLSVDLNYLNNEESYKIPFLLSILILLWTYDTGAFLIGSLLGKHKMFPAFSPLKSWEGFVGGILLTLLVSYFIGIQNSSIEQRHWFFLAFLTSTMAVLGDLFESRLKRQADLKDSGKLIPGHGGILDRIDSFLFVIPVIYFYHYFFISP